MHWDSTQVAVGLTRRRRAKGRETANTTPPFNENPLCQAVKDASVQDGRPARPSKRCVVLVSSSGVWSSPEENVYCGPGLTTIPLDSSQLQGVASSLSPDELDAFARSVLQTYVQEKMTRGKTPLQARDKLDELEQVRSHASLALGETSC